MSDASWRLLAASVSVCAYAALCLAILWRERRRASEHARLAARLAGDGSTLPTLVLFGSQTGQAEAMAWQTATWLRARGEAARVLSLNDTNATVLQGARRALFIASTYGEGDAPDGASVFAETVMGAQAPDVSALRYAVLALGDRQYANFCGFGRALDAWLHGAGAAREHARIEADNADPAALAAWRTQVGGQAAASPDEDAAGEPAPWRLVARECLNPGSAGTPVFHLAFAPTTPNPPQWASGDVVQVTVPGDPTRPRDYSIASISQDGELHLLVRQTRHPDGRLGAASGLLSVDLTVGASIGMRIRAHGNFRLGDNARRPLLLVGNGTGLAGLRGHLRARAHARQHENWLVFGERQARFDRLYGDEIAAWQAQGVLQRVDWVFSRDQEERLYVQHRLLQAADEVQAWVARGAAIYVCGSLQGMASGVDAALRQVLGETGMRTLTQAGRYRRDVY